MDPNGVAIGSERFSPLRVALRAARLLAAVYLGIVLAMSLLETRLVYPAPASPVVEPPPDALEAWIDSTDGVRVHGWLFERPGSERLLLYCHGNAVTVDELADELRIARDSLGASVLGFDYRGYGRTKGTPNEAGVLADASAARAWLARRAGVEPGDVIVLGRSLGGGVAVALASDGGAAALILQDSFTSLVDAAASHYPWLPVSWLMKNRYDSIGRIRRYEGPVCSTHAEKDAVVPPAQGRRLFDAAPSTEKLWIETPSRDHYAPLPGSYWREVGGWLDRLGQRRAAR